MLYDWDIAPHTHKKSNSDTATEFEVCPRGNKEYGLAAFYVFMTHALGFEKPSVELVGNV